MPLVCGIGACGVSETYEQHATPEESFSGYERLWEPEVWVHARNEHPFIHGLRDKTGSFIAQRRAGDEVAVYHHWQSEQGTPIGLVGINPVEVVSLDNYVATDQKPSWRQDKELLMRTTKVANCPGHQWVNLASGRMMRYANLQELDADHRLLSPASPALLGFQV